MENIQLAVANLIHAITRRIDVETENKRTISLHLTEVLNAHNLRTEERQCACPKT